MKKICSNKYCTSCGACVEICPKSAIKMGKNEYGFVFPKIDESICIDCGLCYKKCHINASLEMKYPQDAYAVWSNNPEDRNTSASGGAASVFYQSVLSMNGICYGAKFNEDLNAVFTGYEDHRIVDFKGSKYVHSDMNSIYNSIYSHLCKDKKVLFIGLPCQVAAIKSYLNTDYRNLILVDLICHGVPPQQYLNEHVEHFEKKCSKQAKLVRFRIDNNFCFILCNENVQHPFVKKHRSIDTYMLPFSDELSFYEGCYNCKYACNKRVSDITIGDFWGLGSEEPFNHPYTGAISLVLLNTEKGKSFFETTKESLFYERRTVEEAIKGNDQLNRPSKRNDKRDEFLDLYKDNGFEYASAKIYKKELKRNRRIILFQNIDSGFRQIAKRILRRKG